MRIKQFRWVFLLLAMGIIAPPQSLWAERDDAVCVTQNTKRTFIQLWRSDAALSDEQWDSRFEALLKLGFNEIVIQWSTYGYVSFIEDPRKNVETASCIGALIRSAARNKVRIKMGLQYDPDFWKHIESSKNVNNYLEKRLKEITGGLDALVAVVAQSDPNGSVVDGWYISDEIDDLNWKDAQRRIALATYLKAIRQHLFQKREKWPVSISGYATGAMLPNEWARFCSSLLNTTGIDTFLLQDGVGTGKMTLTDVAAYFSVMASVLKSPYKRFGVIVEIFKIDPSSAVFRTTGATFERIAQQLKLADKYSNIGNTVFSAPDHLIGQQSKHGQKLHQLWIEDQRRCRRHPVNSSSMQIKSHHKQSKPKQ